MASKFLPRVLLNQTAYSGAGTIYTPAFDPREFVNWTMELDYTGTPAGTWDIQATLNPAAVPGSVQSITEKQASNSIATGPGLPAVAWFSILPSGTALNTATNASPIGITYQGSAFTCIRGVFTSTASSGVVSVFLQGAIA